jgi:hypothetical protein
MSVNARKAFHSVAIQQHVKGAIIISRKVFSIICSVFMICGFIPLTALAQVTIVQTGQNYATIVDALNVANIASGAQTVRVSAGTYADIGQHSIFGSDVTLQGDGGTVLVQGSSAWEIKGTNCTLDGITFDFQSTEKDPIQVYATASNLNIRNCTFVDPGHGESFPTSGGSNNRAGSTNVSSNVSAAILFLENASTLIEDCNFENSNASISGSTNDANLHFMYTSGSMGSFIMRRSRLRAAQVNLQIDRGFNQFEVEDCVFEVPGSPYPGASGISGACIWVQNQLFDQTATNIMHNMKVRNCDFTQAEDIAIAFYNCSIDDVLIDNCDFINIGNHCIRFHDVTGYGVTISNCTIDVVSTFEGVGSDAVWFDPDTVLGDAFTLDGITLYGNNFHEWGNTAVNFHGGIDDIVVEANDFGTGAHQPNYHGIYSVDNNQTMLIRDNNFLKLNGDGVHLRASNSSIVRNMFIQDGVAGRSRGVRMGGRATPSSTYIRPSNNLIAYNYFVGLENNAIEGNPKPTTGADYSHSNMRVFNNTIVYCGANGLLLTGNNHQIFNNIIALNGTGASDAGIALQSGASLLIEDFNLLFQANNYSNVPNPGANTMVGVNPEFADPLALETAIIFNQPITPTLVEASLALSGGSAAMRAGTDTDGSLSVSDYQTNIGASQAITIDTGVSSSAWELYR